MGIERFEQLDVWQKAHEAVLAIYRMTARFTAEERYGLVSQMRGAAISAPANIAEGFKRQSRRDKIRFYNISQGSLEEVRYYVRLAKDLEYPSSDKDLPAMIDEVSRMLYGLIKAIDRS